MAKKKFLAVYIGSQNSVRSKEWQSLDEKTRKEREAAGFSGWTKWVAEHRKSIPEIGAPLGRTKRVDASGVADVRNEITAYTVVEAESHEAAAKLFLNHPHFTIFPGDAIEIMECLAIPEKP